MYCFESLHIDIWAEMSIKYSKNRYYKAKTLNIPTDPTSNGTKDRSRVKLLQVTSQTDNCDNTIQYVIKKGCFQVKQNTAQVKYRTRNNQDFVDAGQLKSGKNQKKQILWMA